MSASEAARQVAALSGKILDVERDIEKLEQKLESMSMMLYDHFTEAQVDSLRLQQVTEDVGSVKSSIRYASRTVGAVVGTTLFGIFVAIISSGVGGN